MKAIWTQDGGQLHGEYVTSTGSGRGRSPPSSPHPPVVVGGNGRRCSIRVLRYGDAWAPQHRHGNAAERIPELRRRARGAGRGHIPVTIFGCRRRRGARRVRGGRRRPRRALAPTAPRGPVERELERLRGRHPRAGAGNEPQEARERFAERAACASPPRTPRAGRTSSARVRPRRRHDLQRRRPEAQAHGDLNGCATYCQPAGLAARRLPRGRRLGRVLVRPTAQARSTSSPRAAALIAARYAQYATRRPTAPCSESPSRAGRGGRRGWPKRSSTRRSCASSLPTCARRSRGRLPEAAWRRDPPALRAAPADTEWLPERYQEGDPAAGWAAASASGCCSAPATAR